MLRPAGVALAAMLAVAAAPVPDNAYEIAMRTIDGKPMPWAAHRGKVLLVVNTASMCGFTPQYAGLQELQTRYADRGFTVIGIPSGDFGGQEYEDAAKTKQFCETQFGIRFPLTEKSRVKGPGAAPFYRWAQAELGAENAPKWNFHKYLVGRDGELIAAYGSKVEPGSPTLTRAIETALAERAR